MSTLSRAPCFAQHASCPPPILHSPQVEARTIIMRLSASHGVLYAVLPDDRRLRGMQEILAYFRDGVSKIGTVVKGLYAQLLPHVNFERGDCVVDCTSRVGSNPRECRCRCLT